MSRMIKIESIKIVNEYLPRLSVNESIVEEYAENMIENVKFPPITVAKYNGEYILVDGLHRLTANKLIGNSTIEAKEIVCNTHLELMELALELNMSHGQRLTKEEQKEFAIKLREQGCTIKKIAQLTNKSPATISYWLNLKEEKNKIIQTAIQEITENQKPLSEVARKYGISRKTIYNHMNKDNNKSNENNENNENNVNDITDITNITNSTDNMSCKSSKLKLDTHKGKKNHEEHQKHSVDNKQDIDYIIATLEDYISQLYENIEKYTEEEIVELQNKISALLNKLESLKSLKQKGEYVYV